MGGHFDFFANDGGGELIVNGAHEEASGVWGTLGGGVELTPSSKDVKEIGSCVPKWEMDVEPHFVFFALEEVILLLELGMLGMASSIPKSKDM